MTQDKRLSEFFRLLLFSAMAALNVKPESGFGTIHLFRKESKDGDLRICAMTVEMDTLKPILRAYKGEGVCSWVALNRRPLLCKRRTSKNNEFNRIANNHSQFMAVESQIVVPMLVGSDLIGVVNIESLAPNAFTSRDVHITPAAMKVTQSLPRI
jgi:transcriptional regulator with GAF, ATPase, and Fis domain